MLCVLGFMILVNIKIAGQKKKPFSKKYTSKDPLLLNDFVPNSKMIFFVYVYRLQFSGSIFSLVCHVDPP